MTSPRCTSPTTPSTRTSGAPQAVEHRGDQTFHPFHWAHQLDFRLHDFLCHAPCLLLLGSRPRIPVSNRLVCRVVDDANWDWPFSPIRAHCTNDLLSRGPDHIAALTHNIHMAYTFAVNMWIFPISRQAPGSPHSDRTVNGDHYRADSENIGLPSTHAMAVEVKNRSQQPAPAKR